MTPDQYRREGAEAMRAYIANDCDPAHLPHIDNPTEFHAGYRHAVIGKFTAIRAIDVDEVLAAASVWKGPGETPHRYSPDYMSQGDCRVCGHTREAHQPAPDPVMGLVKAPKACPNCHGYSFKAEGGCDVCVDCGHSKCG